MSKGLILAKFIKGVRAIKYLCLFSLKKNDDFYPPPPENRKIGFLDKNRKVHVEKKYQKYFSENQLFNNGSYKQLKPGNISLIWDGKKVLLKKHYSGFNRIYNFYNEITCYKKLKEISNIPVIKYVDYSFFDVYFEFKEGYCLTFQNIKIIKKDLNHDKIESVKRSIRETVTKIHSKGVFIYDLERDNIVVCSDEVYFIDFADSLYKGLIPSKIFKRFKEHDHFKKNEILSLLYYEL